MDTDWRRQRIADPRNKQDFHRMKSQTRESCRIKRAWPAQRSTAQFHSGTLRQNNVTVHRAAANDIDVRIRATRGSVWSGLLFATFGPPFLDGSGRVKDTNQ